MVTVYERIVKISKKEGFKLHPKHKLHIGSRAAKSYREQGWDKNLLTIVQSEEENGTWMVTAYPDIFRPILNKIIIEYITNLKSKKIIEKPPQNEVKTEPEKKKRTRIPMKAKPAFTSNKK